MRGVEARFRHYLYRYAPAWTLSSDQRFAYYVHVPEGIEEQSCATPIIAIVHGTERRAESCRDAFAEFAEEYGCVVLAPLFPCGVIDPSDTDNYKRILFHDIRFDLILLEMVDEVAKRYDFRPGRLLLHGFSGGGQFVHRFFYLHPQRLAAVSIGAPGAVTLLDDTRDWWVGTRDLQELFGKNSDFEAMRRVRVSTVIGSTDLGRDEITVPKSSVHWMADANHAGDDRQQRLAALRDGLEKAGISVEHTTIPDSGHDARAVIPFVQSFFARVLASC